MYIGLKQPRGDGKRYVTPARAAVKETSFLCVCSVIDHEFRHHIVKVAVDPRGDS